MGFSCGNSSAESAGSWDEELGQAGLPQVMEIRSRTDGFDALLPTEENPPRYWVVMDEAALCWPMGGRDRRAGTSNRMINCRCSR